MSGEWGPGAWVVVMPCSESTAEWWKPWRGEGRTRSCSVLSAKWPLVCSEHVITCVEQSGFQAGKQNSLQASHSSCFTRGLGPDAHIADNGRRMPTLQVGRSPSKRNLGPCSSYTQGTAAGTAGCNCGCTKSLQLWGASAISKPLVLSERSLGSQR